MDFSNSIETIVQITRTFFAFIISFYIAVKACLALDSIMYPQETKVQLQKATKRQ